MPIYNTTVVHKNNTVAFNLVEFVGAMRYTTKGQRYKNNKLYKNDEMIVDVLHVLYNGENLEKYQYNNNTVTQLTCISC